MLDFHITELEDEKKTRITQIRHGENLANLIDQATSRLGVNKSVFLRSVIASAARRILEGQHSTCHVSRGCGGIFKGIGHSTTSHGKSNQGRK